MSVYFKYVAIAIFVILRIAFVFLVKNALKDENRKTRNLVTYLSIATPLIAGIICTIKNKSKFYLILIAILIYAVLYSPNFISQKPNTPNAQDFTTIIDNPLPEDDNERWRDLDGTTHTYAYEVIYYDREFNTYTYDFDVTGYDYLYKNHSDEKYETALCYYDSEGYFYYDEDYSIVLKDEHSCVDTDGTIYYPLTGSKITYDGKIDFTETMPHYDRNGTGYTHEHIPYFDAQGNKYFYSYDVDAVKGTYTNAKNSSEFDWKISYIDRNGYIVFDEKNEFVEDKDAPVYKTFNDKDGNVYYWAPSLFWNENGQLLDHMGDVIE